MTATGTPPTKPTSVPPPGGESAHVAQHNAQMKAALGDDEGALSKEAAAAAAQDAEGLDALEPGAGDDSSWLDKPVDSLKEIRRWVVGKPPGDGGKESEYSVYVQQPLGWMARSRFFSIMTAALSKAIRATGGEVAGMGDVFGEGGGTIRERAQRTFIDQNYEELRGFFTEDLPAIARRVVVNEKARVDHTSASAPSKQSNTSGQQEAATS
jgi:hypothetical protein